jgi:hypothetical protein
VSSWLHFSGFLGRACGHLVVHRLDDVAARTKLAQLGGRCFPFHVNDQPISHDTNNPKPAEHPRRASTTLSLRRIPEGIRE